MIRRLWDGRECLASCQFLFGGENAYFENQAMHAKSLRQDAGDSRQDGGAPLRRSWSVFQKMKAEAGQFFVLACQPAPSALMSETLAATLLALS